jgi:hypothetical protein
MALAALLVVLVVALPIALAARLLRAQGPTAPTVLRVVGGLRPRSCASDRLLPWLVVGESAWSPCLPDQGAFPRGGVARFDPARGELDVRASIPADGPAWFEAVGALPDPRGERVAFVYRSAILEGETSRQAGLATLVAGRDGLWGAPADLSGFGGDDLLGMHWTDAGLEIALGKRRAGERLPNDVVLVSVGERGARVLAEVAGQELFGALADGWVRGAFRGSEGWNFVVVGMKPGADSATWLWTVGRNAPLEPLGAPPSERAGVDLIRAGVLDAGALDRVAYALDAQGGLRPVAPTAAPPRGVRRVYDGLRFVEGGLVRIESLVGDGPPRTRRVDGRSLSLVAGPPESPLFFAVDGKAVARGAGAGFGLLAGAILPRSDRGAYVVDSGGESISLGPEGDRTDPLTPLEHVAQEAPAARAPIAFLLGGVPALALAARLAGRRGARRARPDRARLVVAMAVAYLAVAASWAWPAASIALP